MFFEPIHRYSVKLFLLYVIFLASNSYAQQDKPIRDQYMLTEEQKLQIVVHVWGEVNQPGQYVVNDGTTVLELISMAGGPSQFSNLSNVRLTREISYVSKNKNPMKRKIIYKINMDKYLNSTKQEQIYTLKPGDVVQVKRNSWFRFDTFLRVVTQIAIIIQGLYYSGILRSRN